MFKIFNTAISRKLEITNCSGRLIAQKNGMNFFEIVKDDKVLKFKCSDGLFTKHFKTDYKIDNTITPELKIAEKDYQDLMKFYT